MSYIIVFDIDSLIYQSNLDKNEFPIVNSKFLEKLIGFSNINRERCCLITKYPLERITPIISEIGFNNRCISSAIMTNDSKFVPHPINKNMILLDNSPVSIVLVTGSAYSPDLINIADYVISFGMNDRDLSKELLLLSTHAVYDEEKLCQILQQLL